MKALLILALLIANGAHAQATSNWENSPQKWENNAQNWENSPPELGK